MTPPIRQYKAADFSVEQVVAAKRGRSVSVILPARNEEATIGTIVRAIAEHLGAAAGLVDEIVVVDDASSDGTAATAREAGARVVDVREVVPELAVPFPGKGQAMWKGMFCTRGDVVVFLDGDVRNFSTDFVVGLLGPLLTEPEQGPCLTKGFYLRPLDGKPQEGGRVTELVARPVLSMVEPELASVRQPLAGELAAFRWVLEQVPFCDGYGVEIGLLIDVYRRFGAGAIGEVDLGIRVHRNRELRELSPQALGVLAAALRRAGHSVREVVSLPVLGTDLVEVRVGERPPLAKVPQYRQAVMGRQAGGAGEPERREKGGRRR
jgi:glucosyl-3-phosphoglycerate synthase